MIIRNGKIFNENGQFVDADILLENGKIAKVAPVGTLEGEGIDASGKYVTPGFVDIHTHGCAGGYEQILWQSGCYHLLGHHYGL